MNTRTKALGSAAVLAVVALIFAYPVFAASPIASNAVTPKASAAATTTTEQNIIPQPTALTVGQTMTFTSTQGQWRVISDPTAPKVRSGTAAGTVTLTVTGVFKGGYSLSLTSGSLSINGTTYSTASGSAQMGPEQAHLVGQGSLTNTSPAPFLFGGGAHASFFGSSFNTMRFDVQLNGIEYGVLLVTAVTG